METRHLPHFLARRSFSVANIEYLEGDGNYTIIHLVGERPVMSAHTLKWYAERLPTFWRIHKGTLVNPMYVVDYHLAYSGKSTIQLGTDRTLVVSRRQVSKLKGQLSTLFSSRSR